jgi:hypothetical protein
MAILLKSGATYAAWACTHPTGAPALALVTHETTAPLPGDITMTVSVTAEVCADDTFGPTSAVRWSLSDRPTLMHGLREGEFYDAFEAAIGAAWAEAVALACSRVHVSPRTGAETLPATSA